MLVSLYNKQTVVFSFIRLSWSSKLRNNSIFPISSKSLFVVSCLVSVFLYCLPFCSLSEHIFFTWLMYPYLFNYSSLFCTLIAKSSVWSPYKCSLLPLSSSVAPECFLNSFFFFHREIERDRILFFFFFEVSRSLKYFFFILSLSSCKGRYLIKYPSIINAIRSGPI